MEQATAELSHRYDIVLLEGAGGLMVPLTEELLTIDYVAQKGYPLILLPPASWEASTTHYSALKPYVTGGSVLIL